MLVVSGSYQNDQNGTVYYQLTDVEGGEGKCSGIKLESVDFQGRGGCTVLYSVHSTI
jgi:hypothetical protein